MKAALSKKVAEAVVAATRNAISAAVVVAATTKVVAAATTKAAAAGTIAAVAAVATTGIINRILNTSLLFEILSRLGGFFYCLNRLNKKGQSVIVMSRI